jgi:hypothetical protein
MKWTGIYLIGYVVLVAGLVAALWKMGILASIGVAWTLIGIVIAIGIGIMLAVSSSGKRNNQGRFNNQRRF